MFTSLTLNELATWALFGVIAGFTIHMIDTRSARGGALVTALFGVLGAIVGGFLAIYVLKIATAAPSLQGAVIAIAGGIILAAIERFLFRNRQFIRTKTSHFER